jgi:hypothetical protein
MSNLDKEIKQNKQEIIKKLINKLKGLKVFILNNPSHKISYKEVGDGFSLKIDNLVLIQDYSRLKPMLEVQMKEEYILLYNKELSDLVFEIKDLMDKDRLIETQQKILKTLG